MRLANAFKELCALGLAWAIVAPLATAQTQTPRAYAPGRGTQDPVAPSGNQELIGEALSMAIESSGLLLATKIGTYTRAYGPSVGMGSPSSTGTTARGPRDPSAARDGAQDNSTTGPAGSRDSGAIRRDDYRVLGAVGSPGMAGYILSELQQHALRGFEDSSRLFQEATRRAGGSDSPIGRYLIAARNYAQTLESITGGRNSSRDENAVGGSLNSILDIQSVCLVNHAVKKVLAASNIRAMCRLMGDGAEGTGVLRQHAQQMYGAGTRLIDALASSVDIPANRRAALESGRRATAGTRDNLLGGTGGAVRGDSGAGAEGPGPNARGGYGIRSGSTTATAPGRAATNAGVPTAAGTHGSAMIALARQARELVQALDELNMNSR